MIELFNCIDIIVIISYIIIILSLGFYYSQKNTESLDNYFLAGRNLPWYIVGISIFATNISSEHFIGLAGAGSMRGLAVGQFELMAIFTLIFLGWFLVPIYFKSNIVTVPEFLGKVFDSRIRKFFAIFSILIYLFTKVLVSLFAAGILFYDIFGINIYTSSILIVLITGLYSVTGGANAVMRTQSVQGLVMIIGGVILSIAAYIAGGGFSTLYQKLPSDFFNMFKSISDPDYPCTGINFGAPILAFWYWCTDQYIVQRVLAANSIEHARRGTLFAATLKILPIFILVLPGLFAVSLIPHAQGDEAYSALIISGIVPNGFRGVVVAGLLAAIMSSLAGTFNSISTLYTNDYFKLKYPESSERKLVLVGRLATTAAVVIAILTVPLVKIISSQIYLFLQSVQSFVSPPITAVFLLGLFYKKMDSTAAIGALISGETIGVGRLILELLHNNGVTLHPFFLWILSVNFLHFAIFLFIFTISVILLMNHKKKEIYNEIKDVSLNEINNIINDWRLSLNFTFKEKRLNINFVFSLIILLLITGVWILWY